MSLLLVAPLYGQQIQGSVKDRDSGRALDQALVYLIDTTGATVAFVRSQTDGQYRLRAPAPGRYGVAVRRLGYAPITTPWIALDSGATISYEPSLTAAPTVLSPTIIQAEREDIGRRSRVLGLDVRSLGGNIVTPSQVSTAALGARNYIDVLMRQGIKWISPSELCVRNIRSGGCLAVYIDDMRTATSSDRDRIEMARDMVDPALIDYMVLLRASEAGVLFGTGSENGVLLIYTKRGARRAPMR